MARRRRPRDSSGPRVEWERSRRYLTAFLGIVSGWFYGTETVSAQDSGKNSIAELREGDRIILLGGTFAERFLYSGWLETRLRAALPGKRLTVRNMGWSGDEVALMPRPLNFGELEEHLEDRKADVILLCFGSSESFAGEAGVGKFAADYRALIERLRSRKFNGESPARLVLVSPPAHEQLGPPWPDAGPRNVELERYTGAIEEIAGDTGLPFIDVFRPTRSLMAENKTGDRLTINGIHLTGPGCRAVSQIIALGLGVSDPLPKEHESLREMIVEKNRQFFLRWRPVNGEYIFGRRNKPFGIMTYPPEMEQLDRQIAALEEEIHRKAAALRQKEAPGE